MPEEVTDQYGGGTIAVISDIHGNIDALTAVLRDVDEMKCENIVCLGDIIGYGPAPAECMGLVRKWSDATVLGNHEVMFMEIDGEKPDPREMTNSIWKSLGRCRTALSSGDKAWLRELPIAVATDHVTFVHGSLNNPRAFEYIYDEEAVLLHFDEQETHVSFHGHTHVPAVWVQRGRVVALIDHSDRPIPLDPQARYTICPGSVGQPRDLDTRASYALYNPRKKEVVIRRVSYDIQRAQARFFHVGLSGFNAVRLALGE